MVRTANFHLKREIKFNYLPKSMYVRNQKYFCILSIEPIVTVFVIYLDNLIDIMFIQFYLNFSKQLRYPHTNSESKQTNKNTE